VLSRSYPVDLLESLPVYVINLDARGDRWAAARDSCARAGLDGDVRRFPACQTAVAANGVVNRRIGCLLSHRGVVASAWERGLERVLVLEDDAVLTAGIGGAVAGAFSRLPPGGWDLLYLGHNAQGPMLRVAPDVYRVCRALALHAYVVHARAYARILADLPDDADAGLRFVSRYKAVDSYFADHFCSRLRAYAVWPHLARQADGYSDIEQRPTAGGGFIDRASAWATTSRSVWRWRRLRWRLVDGPLLGIKQQVNPLRKRSFYRRALR